MKVDVLKEATGDNRHRSLFLMDNDQKREFVFQYQKFKFFKNKYFEM